MKIKQHQTLHSHTASPFNSLALYTIFYIVGFLLLYINISVPQVDFADNESYLLYLDSLYYFGNWTWWDFEPATRALILSVRFFSGSTSDSVQIYRLLNTLLFLVSIYYFYRRGSWQSLAIAVALYGPLLALITLRATPAYFFATLGTLAALEGKWKSVIFVLIGFLFHVSALLSLPVVCVVLMLKRYGVKTISSRHIFVALSVFSFFIVLASSGASVRLLAIVNFFVGLEKYTAYLSAAELSGYTDFRSNIKVGHYVFVGAIVGLGFLLIKKSAEDEGILKLFIAFSTVIYLAMFFIASPVVSFRYSPLFILPALSSVSVTFPGPLEILKSFVLAVGCILIFWVGLQQVVISL